MVKLVIGALRLTESRLKATCLVIQLLRCQQEDGREPFTEWITGLRDKSLPCAFAFVCIGSGLVISVAANPSAEVSRNWLPTMI